MKSTSTTARSRLRSTTARPTDLNVYRAYSPVYQETGATARRAWRQQQSGRVRPEILCRDGRDCKCRELREGPPVHSMGLMNFKKKGLCKHDYKCIPRGAEHWHRTALLSSPLLSSFPFSLFLFPEREEQKGETRPSYLTSSTLNK